MSVQAITWALDQKVMNTPSKIVLICLANRANFENVCFPSIQIISKESELSVRTISRALDYLEKRSFVIRSRQVRSNGGRSSNLYTLNMPTPTASLTQGGPVTPDRGAHATVGTYKNNDLNHHNEPRKPSNDLKERVRVKFGSPAFRAWEDAPVAIRKHAVLTRDGDFLVPSEFPPKQKAA